MKIKLDIFGGLDADFDYNNPYIELEKNSTVEHLLKNKLKIKKEFLKFLTIIQNQKKLELTDTIISNDEIKILLPVGGGK